MSKDVKSKIYKLLDSFKDEDVLQIIIEDDTEVTPFKKVSPLLNLQ
jgi:hypothetical protein